MKDLTIKEAVLKTLEDNKKAMTYMEVFEYIKTNRLYEWVTGKTPSDTVSSTLGNFIRKNDSRVKRIKSNRVFVYYLSKYEQEISFENIDDIKEEQGTNNKSNRTYHERDLHKLLASFLKNQNIFTKTILHEQSNRSEGHQKWIHPDMVGVKLVKLKNEKSNALREIISKKDAFQIYSYEIKKSINSDYELKQYFFQAVSNSSWSNYGYLVALEINDNLNEELERLNKSFGIGIIELSANVFESKILFPARYRELDFQTIDKLCNSNEGFETFVHKNECLLSAEDKFYDATLTDFNAFCDDYFGENDDDEIKKYCEKRHIPYDYDDQE